MLCLLLLFVCMCTYVHTHAHALCVTCTVSVVCAHVQSNVASAYASLALMASDIAML